MPNILNKVSVAYYTLENDEIHSYSSYDMKLFTDSYNNETNSDIISSLANKLKEVILNDDSYYKIKPFEGNSKVFECKYNIQDINGILYSFTTYSDNEILALEENKEKFTDFIKLW